MTHDAAGSDAMVGIDDIVIKSQAAAAGNSPPEITAPATATTNEDISFAFTGGNAVSVSDANAGDTLSVTVAVTGGTGVGTLTASGAGVTGSGTASVTISGSQTAVNTALGTLSFAPALNFNGSASITVNATDGTAPAAQKTIAVTVNAVNDEPSATFATATVTVNEDSGPFTQMNFATLVPGGGTDENGQTATYALSNNNTTLFSAQPAIASNGTLTFTPAANAFGSATITVVVTDNGGTANSGDNTSQDLTFTITVNALNDAPTVTAPTNTTVNEDTTTGPLAFTIGDVETPAASLTVTATSGNTTLVPDANITLGGSGASRTITIVPAPNQSGTATITLTVSDGSAMTSTTFDVTFTAVNDAPTLNGANNLTAINEDPATNAGTLVSDLISGQTSDPDGPMLGIAVTGTASASGTWQYALDGTSFVNFDTVTPATARLLAADATTRVRFVPNANFNGTVSSGLTFRAWDRSAGMPNDVANASTGGDATAFSSMTASASITVNSVNDAPSGAPKTVTINQDAVYTFSAADFGFSDLNDSPANTLLAVKITSTPMAGTLALSGMNVSADQFIPVGSLGNLTFTPAAGASGMPYASFTFQVQDNGTTANSGVDLDPTARTFTFNVNAVNGAPSGSDKTVTINEDATYTFSAADFALSDADGHVLMAVKITSTPGAGTLALSGMNVSADQFIPVGSLGNLTFTPAPNANGMSYASFTFQVQDNGGTNNNGVDLDQSPNTFAFNVTALNDAPTVTAPGNATIAEDSATAALAFTIGDVETPAASLTVTATSGNATLVPDANITLGGSGTNRTITVTPAANQSGTATITLTVSDGSAMTTATFDVIVTAVNDAPTATDDPLSAVGEDSGARTIAFSDLLGNDSAGPNESGQALTIISVENAIGGSVSIQGTDVIFTPTADFNGTARFDYTVRDNGTTNGAAAPLTDVGSVSFTVTAVNDAPTLDALMSVSGTVGVPQTVNLSGITAGGGESQGLTVTATSSNPSVVASPVSVSYTSPGATGSLTFTPLSGGSTTITVRVTDDGSPSQFTERTFVVAVNNLAPVNTFPTDVATNEDTPLAFTGANTISIDDPDDTLGAVTTVVSVPMGSGTLSSGAMSGTALTFTGTAAQVNAALADLVYAPPADANSATLDGSVTLRVTTTDGGGAVSEESAVRITVNPVNDAPSFTPGVSPAAVNEDAGPQTATDFVTGISRGPADESAQALAFEITGNSNPGLFSTAPAINADGTLTFTPAPNAFGTATITYRLMDSGGTDNGGVEFSDAQTFTITVNPIPDAPTGTDATLALTEDGTLTLSAADFGFSDAIDAPADGFAGVVLTTLPTKGALTLAGAAVTAGQFIAAADLGNLVFTPMPNAAGTGYATLTFQVQDDNADGDNLDPTPNTLTFDVAGINDEPSLSLNVDAFFVNQTGPFAQNGFAVFAPGGGADEAAQTPSFAVTVAPGGAALFAVQPVIDAAGRLTFTPAPGATGATTVTVTAFDGGSDGGANDAFSQSRTFSISLQVPLTGDASGAVGGALNTAPAVATGAQLIAVGSAPGTPARVMLLDAGTGAVVRDFAPFGGFLGGLRVAVADVTGDGKDDLIVATASQLAAVAVFDGATGGLVNAFVPFGAFPGGAQIATGDVNGDGRADIVVGLDTGAPLIVALDGATGAVLRVFGGLPAAGGGTNMAVGDFTGDGAADVATAGAGGLVVVFDGRTGAVADAFFAVPGYTGDLNLAMGDVDGDGLSELVLGIPVGGTAVAGAFGRGGRLAKVYSVPTGAGTPQPVAPGVLVSPAAQLAIADIDGDGFADLLVSTPPGAGLSQTVALSGKTGAVIRTATNPLFGAGADVAAG